MGLRYYKAMLNSILKHLTRYQDPYWPNQLPQWIALIDHLEKKPEMRVYHLRRTQKTLVEQWSDGRLTIAPINGHQIENDKVHLDAANRKLSDLISSLQDEINTIFQATVQ